jgi:hypothetical protein
MRLVLVPAASAGQKVLRLVITCLLPLAGMALVASPLFGQARSNDTPAAPNTLSPAEKAAGWKLLFDGKTTNGWRAFHSPSFPSSGWVIEDGALKRVAANGRPGGGGDIITADEYGDFELTLDWKLSPGGNSGLKYLISEDLVKAGNSGVGFEMQILDDERHPDAKAGKNGNRTAGSLYDLIAPGTHAARAIGEWNQVRLVVHGGHVEQWLNGKRVVEFQIGSPEMKALIADSKYKDIKGFGDVTTGHILLQDHGNEVLFRNIKIRDLANRTQL